MTQRSSSPVKHANRFEVDFIREFNQNRLPCHKCRCQISGIRIQRQGRFMCSRCFVQIPGMQQIPHSV